MKSVQIINFKFCKICLILWGKYFVNVDHFSPEEMGQRNSQEDGLNREGGRSKREKCWGNSTVKYNMETNRRRGREEM